MNLKDELSVDEEIYATIAYDSAKVDHLFVLNAQPFDGIKKSKICHLYHNSSSKTDDIIKDIIQQIVEAGKMQNVSFCLFQQMVSYLQN